MKEKLLRLVCYKCKKEFRKTCNIAGDPVFYVECEHCKSRCRVNLKPFGAGGMEVYKSERGDSTPGSISVPELPDILETTEPED